MPRIAINYRGDNTRPWTGRLFDRLSTEFGRNHVFMDIDHLEPGADFVEEINRAVVQSQVLIVMIGPDWATIKDPQGHRRLDNPMDFVRLEIATALDHGIRIVPVLVGNAVMPIPDELPEGLKPLARRHATEISDLRFTRMSIAWSAASGPSWNAPPSKAAYPRRPPASSRTTSRRASTHCGNDREHSHPGGHQRQFTGNTRTILALLCRRSELRSTSPSCDDNVAWTA